MATLPRFGFLTTHLIILLSENFDNTEKNEGKYYIRRPSYSNMDGWTDRDILEGLRSWVEDVNDLDGEALILVEGKRDLASLEAIGVHVPAIALNQGMELYDLLDSLTRPRADGDKKESKVRIIVLTDWDRKGGQLSSRVSKACAHLGIPYDTELRRRLVHMTGRYIRTVESLDSIIERLEGGL